MAGSTTLTLLVGIALLASSLGVGQEAAAGDPVARLDKADTLEGRNALEIYEEIWKREYPRAVRGRAACGAAFALLERNRRDDALDALADGLALLESAVSRGEESRYEWISVELAACYFLQGLNSDEIPASGLEKALDVLLAPGVPTRAPWRRTLEDTLRWFVMLGDDAADAADASTLRRYATRLSGLSSEPDPSSAGLRVAAAWIAAVAERREGNTAAAVSLLADATGEREFCQSREQDFFVPILRILAMQELAHWLHEAKHDASAASWAHRSVTLTTSCMAQAGVLPLSVRTLAIREAPLSFGAQALAQRMLEREYALFHDLLGADAVATATAEVELATVLILRGEPARAQDLLSRAVPPLARAGAPARPLLISALEVLIQQRLTPETAARLEPVVADQLAQSQARTPRDPSEEALLSFFLGELAFAEHDLNRAETWLDRSAEQYTGGQTAFDIHLALAELHISRGWPWKAERDLERARLILSEYSGDAESTRLSRARYENFAGVVAYDQGKPLVAEKHLRNAMALLATRPTAPLLAAGNQLSLLPVLSNLGKTEEAVSLAHELLEKFRSWGPSYSLELGQVLSDLAEVDSRRLDWKGAGSHLAEAMQALEESGQERTGLASSIRCFQVQVELLQRKPPLEPAEIARRLRMEASAWWSRGSEALACQARAAAFLYGGGREEQAAAVIRDLIPRLQEMFGERHPWVSAEMVSLAGAVARFDRDEALHLLRILRGDLRHTEGSSPETLREVEEMIEWLEAADAASDSSVRTPLPAEAPSPSPQPEHR